MYFRHNKSTRYMVPTLWKYSTLVQEMYTQLEFKTCTYVVSFKFWFLDKRQIQIEIQKWYFRFKFR